MELSLSRRRAVGFAAGAALAAGFAIGPAGCAPASRALIPGPPIRRDLTRVAGLEPYVRVVAAMKALPETDPRSWPRQARLHLSYGRHGSWLFLPWHRAFLHFFGEIGWALSGDPTFAMPYWDWCAHPAVPAPFLDPASPLYQPLRAAVVGSAAAPEFVGAARLSAVLAEPNFLVFGGQPTPRDDDRLDGPGYGTLEQGPHNYIHAFVGGSMSGFASPLDPIFRAHHSYLDRLWQQWGGVAPDAPDWRETRFTEFVDGRGRPTAVWVRDLVTGSTVSAGPAGVVVGVPRPAVRWGGRGPSGVPHR